MIHGYKFNKQIETTIEDCTDFYNDLHDEREDVKESALRVGLTAEAKGFGKWHARIGDESGYGETLLDAIEDLAASLEVALHEQEYFRSRESVEAEIAYVEKITAEREAAK